MSPLRVRHPWQRLRQVPLVWVVVASLLTGCGGSGKDDPAMQPTINTTQAADRVQTHIRDAVAALGGNASLEPMGATDRLPCDEPDDNGPAGRVIVEHQYAVTGLVKAENQRYFDAVQRFWESRGYRRMSYQKRGARWVMVYTDSDGFRVRLATSVDGAQVTIRSQSPCIWPDGTPRPGHD